MSEIQLKSEEIDEIFKNHLKTDSKVMSIETIFANKRFESKIIYDPYYQRNYVWDSNKASYFIESILLGTETPPLVFFNNQETIEIIDGRQRYETIRNFLHKKTVLSKNGLTKLKFLENKDFSSLDQDIQNILWDTKIRIIEFSIVNEPRLDENKEDLIKKEIFRRYNSGITPLKSPEIENAIYIDDDLTKFFKNKLKYNNEELTNILGLFFNERDREQINQKETLDKVLTKIRHLLVLHNIPIKRFSTLAGRNDVLAKFYIILSNNMENVEKFYANFNKKISINLNLRRILQTKNSELFKNQLIYECTFWMLTILENELKDITPLDSDLFLSEYADYLMKEKEKFSRENYVFYKNINERYTSVSTYFSMKFELKFNLYLDDYSEFRRKMTDTINQNIDENEINKLETLRLNKPEPVSMTIEDVCRQMNRNRFLLRPSYQRREVINKSKSSALIESILLGIKIPPIFLYKRIDGIYEVIDGQQRILSILGFMGEEFLNEDNEKVKSEKNKFKFKDLRILQNFNGIDYENLPEQFKDKILDFNLSVVIIDQKINPNFDPIDLFIRLNNKPYPIRDHSFEMWNSYIEKDVISKIKDNTKKNSTWFYLIIEKNNSRMANEELYTSLVYLEFKTKTEKIEDITESNFLTVYQRENNINVRIKEKPDITKTLNLVTTDEKSKTEFIQSIKSIESFIKKVRIILLDKDSDELDEFLRSELNKLFYSKSTRRTTQSFYSLWIILNDINLEMIKKHRIEIKNEIIQIFEKMKNIQDDQDGLKIYKNSLNEFKQKYTNKERKINLTLEEKKNLITKQRNVCPICNNLLFIGDDIEVDHINPIAIGGRDGFLNLQIAHKDCNRKKGSQTKEKMKPAL